MITPSFGLTATERVLPRMALDFTTASLDPRVTFTRTSNTATVTNSSGYVVPINADLPRFDYNPIFLVCKGLLIEESRENIATYSAQFDQAVWNKDNSSITANATLAPSGALDGDDLIDNAVTGVHRVRYEPIVVLGGTYTISVYVKKLSVDYFFIRENLGGVSGNSFFNISNGTIGTVDAGRTASITSVGNGWYRCSIVTTATAGSKFISFCAATADNTPNYTGTGVATLSLWGAQFELGAFISSYIPTVATAVTRNADVATMTGTNFSSWYNASASSYVAEFTTPTGFASGSVYNLVTFWNGSSANNQITSRYGPGLGGSPGTIDTWVRENAVTVVDSGGATIQANTTYKHAVAVELNSGANSTNAGTIFPAAPTSMPTGVTVLTFAASAASQPNHTLRKFFYFPQRLLNAELQAFSK
jgi:hypothetical protein